MNSVKASAAAEAASTRRHPHIGVLLRRARRLVDEAVLAALHEASYSDLRYAHDGVFSFLPTDGARLTELARRARMTKQSMGELVRDLEALGYVSRAEDPADGRAKVIRFTAKGQRANEVGILAIHAAERTWAATFGESRVKTMRDALEQISLRRDGRIESPASD